eukprot:244015-Pyramimonas_sp.AAC.1
MQLLRQPLPVLGIVVDQQVAPHIAAVCCPQGQDGLDESEDGRLSMIDSGFTLGVALPVAPADAPGA